MKILQKFTTCSSTGLPNYQSLWETVPSYLGARRDLAGGPIRRQELCGGHTGF